MDILAVIAVIGAWVGGLGIIFSATCFCYGILRPKLLRWGLNYLLVTDIGLIVMLVAVIFRINDNTTLQVFSAVGVVVLLGLTVAGFIAVRAVSNTFPGPTKVIETARRRIEF